MLAVVDGADNSIQIVPTGIDPTGLVVDADRNRVYLLGIVSAEGRGVLGIVDGSTHAITTVPFNHIEARGLAFNPTYNRLYSAGGGSLFTLSGIDLASRPSRPSPNPRRLPSTRAPGASIWPA